MTKLREVMDERNLTLAEVAAGTGLDSKTVWHATHSRKLHRSTRISIARFLDMPEEAIFPISNIPESIQEMQNA